MRRASVLKEATPENLTLAPFPLFPAPFPLSALTVQSAGPNLSEHAAPSLAGAVAFPGGRMRAHLSRRTCAGVQIAHFRRKYSSACYRPTCPRSANFSGS